MFQDTAKSTIIQLDGQHVDSNRRVIPICNAITRRINVSTKTLHLHSSVLTQRQTQQELERSVLPTEIAFQHLERQESEPPKRVKWCGWEEGGGEEEEGSHKILRSTTMKCQFRPEIDAMILQTVGDKSNSTKPKPQKPNLAKHCTLEPDPHPKALNPKTLNPRPQKSLPLWEKTTPRFLPTSQS